MKSQTRNMIFRVWFYFLLLTGTILLFMWMLQIAFIEPYYEQYRTNTIVSVVNEIEKTLIKEDKGTTNAELTALIGRETMCVAIFNQDARNIGFVDNLGSSCTVNSISKSAIRQYMAKTSKGKDHDFSLRFMNARSNQGMFLYMREVHTAEGEPYYITVNSQIELLDSTVYVLKRQFGLLALIVFSIATFVGFLLSRRLSHPISQMTHSAKKLALGDYSVTFEGEGYQEVVELADTLNYATSEFRKTDELRRDLVANVSHDIKTPLTMIKAYAEMIEDISGDKPDLRKKHLDIILEETNHLERLVNDMLTLSKYESEVFVINEHEFNLYKHIVGIVNLFQGLHLNFKIKVNRNFVVIADEIKMGQVLYNYINNASKYVGEDNTITISAQAELKDVIVSIQDKGVGIEAGILDNIWDRYYKIDKNFSRSDSSSGLGLSIVKAICEATGSKYWVKSELGKGSSFFYTLKRKER